MRVFLHTPSGEALDSILEPIDDKSCVGLLSSLAMSAYPMGGDDFLRLQLNAKLLFDIAEYDFCDSPEIDFQDYNADAALVVKSLQRGPFEKGEKLASALTDKAVLNDNAHKIVKAAGHSSAYADELTAVVCEAYRKYYQLDFIEDPETSMSGLFLTPNPVIAQLYLKTRPRLDSNLILPILAYSGLSILLPEIDFVEGVKAEEKESIIQDLRQKHADLRNAYLSHINKYISDCYQAMKSHDYEDIYHFADIELRQNLVPAMHEFKMALNDTSNAALLKKSGEQLFDDSVGIFQACLSGNFLGAGGKALRALLGFLDKRGEARQELDQFSHLSYAYKISQSDFIKAS